MELSKLIEGLDPVEVVGSREVDVTSLTYNSSAVQPGSLFFCVKGFKVDGHDFAADAVTKGAVVLVCERQLDLDVTQVVVGDVRSATASVAANFFGRPSSKLRVVGITGTNGKTTTAYLVRHIFESVGTQCGLMGTVEQIVGGISGTVEHTTPESVDLQSLLAEMAAAGDSACAMEVSSHALQLNRCDQIDFSAAVFTNLTQDHLDFHNTMDEYFSAKRGLFFPSEGRRPGASIVNADDEFGARLIFELRDAERRCLSYGIEANADFKAKDVSFSASGSSFTVVDRSGNQQAVTTLLPGRFNVYNALTAYVTAISLGVGGHAAAEALQTAKRAPGRFEPVDIGQDFSVLVDYAHTPDSLENILKSAREITKGRLITVFGCGGDRDRGKRPQMGQIAAKLADQIIVTSDNPRSENPDAIIAEIAAGIDGSDGVEVIPDRKEAIRRALAEAHEDDTVVIAGKGHEQGQEFKDGEKIPFDDRQVARETLLALAGSGSEA